jgi:hypothetical protein
MSNNGFAQANRIKKAWRIIDALDRLFGSSLGWNGHADGNAIAHHLETWDAEKWASVALIAGTTVPSDVTKSMVLERYRHRAAQWQVGSGRTA